MRTPYLICYDIPDDRRRKQVADRLLADGLERVQYSVFMGPLSPGLYQRLEAWLRQTLREPEERLIILPVTPGEIEKMCILGEPELDRLMLSGRRHTLFL